jgi:hypothetical protein
MGFASLIKHRYIEGIKEPKFYRDIDRLVDELFEGKLSDNENNSIQLFSKKNNNFFKSFKFFYIRKTAVQIISGLMSIVLLLALFTSGISQINADSGDDVIILIEPNAVYNGETVHINISIPNYYNVSSLKADIEDIDTFDLFLVDNSSNYHFWTGSWVVQNMSFGSHIINIVGSDFENSTYSASVEWEVLAIKDNTSNVFDDTNKTINGTEITEVINNEFINGTNDDISDKEKNPPIVDKLPDFTKAFDRFDLPENVLGPSSLKIVNMTFFWEYFDKNSKWILEVFDTDNKSWIDATDHLIVDKDKSESDQYEKVSLEFTAPVTGDYRLTYSIDIPLKSYVNKSREHIYELVYPIGNDDEYFTYFDFSDIAALPKIIVNHGIRNIGGKEFFWFSTQRNNIGAGTNVVLDPTFGNTGTSNKKVTILNRISGGYFQMGSGVGLGTSIYAYLTTSGSRNAKCALYDSSKNLVTNSITEEKSISTGWNGFNFGTNKPVLTADAWYYIVCWSTGGGAGDLYYAASGGYGVFYQSETYVGGSYSGFPNSITTTTEDDDGYASIYCNYDLLDFDPPTPNPMTWATEPYNVSSSNITMIATTASDATTPIYYYFNETTGNSGGTDSGWQTSTTYSDTGLSENTQYGYEVKARDSNSTPNEGSYSTPISYEYTSVEPPTDGELNLTAGLGWINATVAEPPNPASGSSGSYFNWVTGGANNSGWQNGIYFHNRTALTENTQYGAQVRYRNGDGDACAYNPTEITNYTLVNAPTDEEFTIDSHGVTCINMSVLHPTNPLAGSTAAYFECVTGGVADSGWIITSSSGRYYYNITGLLGDRTYGFRVKYRNANGYETTYTSEKQNTTDPPVPPVVHTNTSTGVEETNATLRGWLQFNGTADTICYFLLNDTNDFGVPIFNISKGIIANGYEFENNTAGETTLTQGKLYYYKAQANNSGGWADGEVKIFLTKPETLSSFTATLIGATQINLSWTNGLGGDGAYIEYAMNSAPSPWNPGDGNPVDADGNVTSTFSHMSLNPGTRYYYKAWAYATDGGWTSSGNQTAPRGDNPQTADATTTGSPSVITNEAEGIEETNTTLVGQLLSNGTLDTTTYFLWGVQNPPTDHNVSQGDNR